LATELDWHSLILMIWAHHVLIIRHASKDRVPVSYIKLFT
jgi:hypothetical protein